MEPLVVSRQVTCRSGVGPLWCALADTNRLNEALGMAPVEPEPVDGAGGARYAIATRLAGMRLRYQERPFEWREREYFAITRVFDSGPATQYRFTMRFGDGDPTEIAVELAVTPRAVVYWPLVRVNVGRAVARLAEMVREVDDNLQRGEPGFVHGRITPVNGEAFARAAAQLRDLAGADRDAADAVARHVAEAPDLDMARIRPYELADALDLDRRLALSLCLQAVSAGLLELRWEIICPSCRTGAAETRTLAELGDTAHCHFCDLAIGVDLDRAVEATFCPAPAVRAVHAGPFCIGGPFRTPHVVTQAVLEPGQTRALHAPEAPGRYRLFVRGGASASVEIRAGGERDAALAADAAATPAALTVEPGAAIRVTNRADDTRHVKLERLEWASRAATASEVSTMATFRRLFSAEVLAPGRLLKVARVALVFSDLCGSTELYARAGDAIAYRFVQEHFDALGEVIASHGGAVVKTIGDAIMAAFSDDAAALRAAVAMQHRYRALAGSTAGVTDVWLRVGVYAGACYAVTANSALDYFGQTVNIAARLEGVAGAGEVVATRELAETGARMGWLDGAHVVETFDAALKGVSGPVPAARIRIHAHGDGSLLAQ